MAAYFWYCLLLFWSPLTSTGAHSWLPPFRGRHAAGCTVEPGVMWRLR
jgi:hypothetical protein